MDVTARQQLAALVRQRGPGVIDDARQCEALLRDLCAASPREVNVLVSALRSGVPGQLAASSPSIPAKLRVGQLVDHLRQTQGLAPDAAQWAVESWALALGVLAPADVTPAAGEPRGEDLVLNVTLTAEEARTGCRKDVVHEGRTLHFTFPAGTASGREFRVTGKGRPSAGRGARGDLVVTAQVALASGTSVKPTQVSRQPLSADAELMRRLPAHVWMQCGAVPVGRGPRGIEIAMSDPHDLPALDTLRAAFGTFQAAPAHEADIRDALASLTFRATSAPVAAPAAPPPVVGPVPGMAARGYAAPGLMPPDYLTGAVLATLCCCVPFGIAAIVYSSQARTRWSMGDQIGAINAANAARNWLIASIAVGALLGVLSVVVNVAGMK
jgi:hypothetical protein